MDEEVEHVGGRPRDEYGLIDDGHDLAPVGGVGAPVWTSGRRWCAGEPGPGGDTCNCRAPARETASTRMYLGAACALIDCI